MRGQPVQESGVGDGCDKVKSRREQRIGVRSVQRCAVAGSTYEISVGECIGPFLERDGRMQKIPRS